MEYAQVIQRVLNPPDTDFVGIGVSNPDMPVEELGFFGKALWYFKLYFPALMSLALGSGILGGLYILYDYVCFEVRKKMYSNVTINKKEETFNWINNFIRDSGWVQGDGSLTCRIKQDNMEWWEEIFTTKNDKEKPKLEYCTGPGTYVCRFKDTIIWAVQERGEMLTVGWDEQPETQEWITLTCRGPSAAILKEFIEAAIVHSMKK